jgi:hypothetical protein
VPAYSHMRNAITAEVDEQDVAAIHEASCPS